MGFCSTGSWWSEGLLLKAEPEPEVGRRDLESEAALHLPSVENHFQPRDTVNELPQASGSHVASSSRLGNPEMGEGADCYLEMYV